MAPEPSQRIFRLVEATRATPYATSPAVHPRFHNSIPRLLYERVWPVTDQLPERRFLSDSNTTASVVAAS